MAQETSSESAEERVCPVLPQDVKQILDSQVFEKAPALRALLAYLYLQFTKPGYNNDGNFTAVIMAFAFLIGLQICQVFMTPIGSGVETIFVAMGWDPQVMINDHPEIYYKLVELYPQVQQAVHA